MDEDQRYLHNVPAARALRQRETQSERILWDRLRNRRFRGLKFRRQHAVFAYVLDFYCAELRLAIEIDGGIHARRESRERDRTRQLALEELGIRFVRIRADHVERDVDTVLNGVIAPSIGSPHPTPGASHDH